MTSHSLYGRIAIVFATILLSLGALLGWLGYSTAKTHQHEIVQRINRDLAAHIAEQSALIDNGGFDNARVDALFRQLLAVNPNIEVYLLDTQGHVLRGSTNTIVLARGRVDLEPIRAMNGGATLPILGDNPRHRRQHDVFSAAPIHDADGSVSGYVYIVLLNDMYRAMVEDALQGYVLRNAGWIATIALFVALGAGLTAFAWITRRLDRLTREVEAFESAAPRMPGTPPSAAQPPEPAAGDEIDRLTHAFASMRAHLQAHMAELQRQDVLRRELVANVSHDLRTPLTSMQGYLESLVRMEHTLSRSEQKRYLEVAVRQSHKVSRLAQQLFELARLECEETLPEPELFSTSELVQDVAQKFALTAQNKGIRLQTQAVGALFVHGDIGMIERAISNLVDNAIRHTPQAGEILLEARPVEQGVEIRVADTGQGITAEHLPGLLERGSPLRIIAARRGGGLGLLIAQRILSLHGSQILAVSHVGRGTQISFVLPEAAAA